VARADYFEIEKAIAAQIRDDAAVAACEAQVFVEQPVEYERGRYVLIFARRRTAPAGIQQIAAGQRTRFEFVVDVWCFAFELEVDAATRARDDLLGLVELALMKDRRFGRSDVVHSNISGGEFEGGLDDHGFASGASIELTLDVTAVTT